MNLNKIYKPSFSDTHSEDICTRGKLDTGKNCNYSCAFCYYQGRLHEKDSFETIKNRIDFLKESGITEVDLSGGESSLHNDWFKILDYCTFNNLYISTLSNGSLFHDMEFLKKSYEHGLREILFSLHGWDDESHNQRIGGHEKAFTKIIKAIKNSQELGMIVRINCTVDNNFNSSIYTKLINDIKPHQVNFLPMNYWESAQNQNAINYSQVSKDIKTAINDIDKNIEINVRYIPFCFMLGYEEYVVGTYQHIFDKRDWNIDVYDINGPQPKTSKIRLFEKAFKNREITYTKPMDCLQCRYLKICDGIEHSVLKDNSLKSIKGDIIQDVMHYRYKHFNIDS